MTDEQLKNGLQTLLEQSGNVVFVLCLVQQSDDGSDCVVFCNVEDEHIRLLVEDCLQAHGVPPIPVEQITEVCHAN